MITYYGGKASIAHWVISHMPAHMSYVEPFAGGLAVLWRKPPSALEVINDIDERLVRVYRVLQDEAEARELMGRLLLTPVSRAEYKRAAQMLREPGATEVELAWAALVQVVQSINCRFGSGLRTSSPEGTTVQAKTWTSQLVRICEGIERLRFVEIECRDALQVIEHRDDPDALIYCDPPYPGTHQGHYAGFTQADFEKLWVALSKLEGHAMVSCYAGTVTPEMAEGWRVERLPTRSCANTFAVKAGADTKDTSRVEELWIRSPRGGQRSLFQLGALEGVES